MHAGQNAFPRLLRAQPCHKSPSFKTCRKQAQHSGCCQLVQHVVPSSIGNGPQRVLRGKHQAGGEIFPVERWKGEWLTYHPGHQIGRKDTENFVVKVPLLLYSLATLRISASKVVLLRTGRDTKLASQTRAESCPARRLAVYM